MDNIKLNGANAVNTLDSQAATTGDSFSMKIGRTRFIVHVLVAGNGACEKISVITDLL